jgi:hypothetical protein
MSETRANPQGMDATRALVRVLSELAEGTEASRPGVVLNTGDVGLLRSLEKLSPADASQSAEGGATIAAHAQHLRFGFSLLNRWAREGGDPFTDARWDEAWKISTVDEGAWYEIRTGLLQETDRWREALASRPPTTTRDLHWMIGSIAHLAYHLGAIRQIHRALRGPREGTFAPLPPSTSSAPNRD